MIQRDADIWLIVIFVIIANPYFEVFIFLVTSYQLPAVCSQIKMLTNKNAVPASVHMLKTGYLTSVPKRKAVTGGGCSDRHERYIMY